MHTITLCGTVTLPAGSPGGAGGQRLRVFANCEATPQTPVAVVKLRRLPGLGCTPHFPLQKFLPLQVPSLEVPTAQIKWQLPTCEGRTGRGWVEVGAGAGVGQKRL